MLRAQYERHGPVPQDVIHAVELDTPRPAAGQALLEVIAAPINPSDVLTLTGEYGDLPPLPAIGGREGVGRVADLGRDTNGPEVGQLVLLPSGCGSWSSHVIAEAAQLVELPNEADPQQLAMMRSVWASMRSAAPRPDASPTACAEIRSSSTAAA